MPLTNIPYSIKTYVYYWYILLYNKAVPDANILDPATLLFIYTLSTCASESVHVLFVFIWKTEEECIKHNSQITEAPLT